MGIAVAAEVDRLLAEAEAALKNPNAARLVATASDALPADDYFPAGFGLPKLRNTVSTDLADEPA